MEARNQTKAVCHAAQAMPKGRGDKAAQDAARDGKLVKEEVWGRERRVAPRAARGRDRGRANIAAPNSASVGQP